jgi:Fe-S oxidoreductase
VTHVYAPGCALMLYKPQLAERLRAHLDATHGGMLTHLTCCRHEPHLDSGTVVINTCSGCDRRYRELYEGVSTVPIWEVLVADDSFDFPDYGGAQMAIHDACPTRTETRVHVAVRALLDRMNIVVVEPPATRLRAICCGDSFFGELPDERVTDLMARRAASMPREDVVVYCVSCIKAMHTGGRTPRYLVDLLFAEETSPGVCEPAPWHTQLDEFIDAH